MQPTKLAHRLRVLEQEDPRELDLVGHLRKSLATAGANQGDIAAELGVTRQTVSTYMSGAVVPIRAIVLAWALLTGYKLSDLLPAWEKAWAEQAASDRRRKGDITLGHEDGVMLTDFFCEEVTIDLRDSDSEDLQDAA